MGGDYYDRPVLPAPKIDQHQQPHEKPVKAMEFSDDSHMVFAGNGGLHKSNDPKRFFSENLICKHQSPIVFALDVTGSMGDWPKVIRDCC